MTGFGAIVKSVEGWLDGVISVAERALRRRLRDRRPKLCAIPVVSGRGR